MGIKSAVFDPVGNVPEHGDFLSNMRQNIENLKPVFRQQGAEWGWTHAIGSIMKNELIDENML